MSVSGLCQKDVHSQGMDGAYGVCFHVGTERDWSVLSEKRIFVLVASVC